VNAYSIYAISSLTPEKKLLEKLFLTEEDWGQTDHVITPTGAGINRYR